VQQQFHTVRSAVLFSACRHSAGVTETRDLLCNCCAAAVSHCVLCCVVFFLQAFCRSHWDTKPAL
jgi:hypothetical protein